MGIPDQTGNPIVRQIVDRLHVGESNLNVARALYKALKPEARRDPSKRDFRRAWMVEAFRVHAENRALYHDVMNGRF